MMRIWNLCKNEIAFRYLGFDWLTADTGSLPFQFGCDLFKYTGTDEDPDAVP